MECDHCDALMYSFHAPNCPNGSNRNLQRNGNQAGLDQLNNEDKYVRLNFAAQANRTVTGVSVVFRGGDIDRFYESHKHNKVMNE